MVPEQLTSLAAFTAWLDAYDAPFPWYMHYSFALKCIGAYLATIGACWVYMRNREPKDVKVWIWAHNMLLCGYSGTSALLSFWAAISFTREHGFHELYCNDEATMTRGTQLHSVVLWRLCTLFYFSKVPEFIDTVLLILRRKPLIFLHVWHHMSVVPLALAFLREEVSFFIFGMMWNTSVHTFMYYYYTQAAYGRDVWWKRYLTMLQMVQFAYGISTHLAWPFKCTGPPGTNGMLVFYWNMFVLTSFLVLFLNFYFKTYASRKSAGKSASSSVKKAQKTN